MREKIKAALPEALRSGDKVATKTLRLILAAIKDRDIVARAEGEDEFDEASLTTMLHGMIKQRRESIRQFRKGNRPDLVEAEEAEIAIISRFLPEPLSPDELRAAVLAAIDQTQPSGLKDMGGVLECLKAAHPGQIDVAAAAKMVKALLLEGNGTAAAGGEEA